MNGPYILKQFLRLRFSRNPFPLDVHSLTVKLCHFVFGELCPLDHLPRTTFHTSGYYMICAFTWSQIDASSFSQDLKEIQLQYTRWNCQRNLNQRQIMILSPQESGLQRLKLPVFASPSPSEMSSASLCTPKNVVSPALKNQEKNRPSNRSQKGKDMRQP